jgi:hypothetical protein
MPYLLPETAEHDTTGSGGWRLPFGIVDDTGMPVADAGHYRNGVLLTDEATLTERFRLETDLPKIDGRWFFAGILYSHFGHFFTESVHRLIHYIAHPSRWDGLVFIKSAKKGKYDHNPLKEGSFERFIICEYFGIDINKILICEHSTYFVHLDAFPQAAQLGMPAEILYLRFLKEIERQYLAKSSNSERVNHPSLIFMSRSHYLTYGRALGMAAIEAVYQENGFTIVQPESSRMPSFLVSRIWPRFAYCR